MRVLEAHGYKVLGLVVRKQKHRKQTAKRKRRSVYEGVFIYVRVRLVNGRKRDLYLGTPAAAAARPKKRVENEPELEDVAGELGRGGETGWRTMPGRRSSGFPRGRR